MYMYILNLKYKLRIQIIIINKLVGIYLTCGY